MAKTCRSCGQVAPDTADHCECGSQLHGRADYEGYNGKWRLGPAAYWLVVVLVGVGLLALGIKDNLSNSEQTRQSMPSSAVETGRLRTRTEVPPYMSSPVAEAVSWQISVQNQIVKQVGGKHRYFFDVRNTGARPFAGQVTITLLGNSGPLGRETFNATRPIAPGLGTSVYLDISTGPVAVHGEYGIERYAYEVRENGQTITQGSGAITERLERF